MKSHILMIFIFFLYLTSCQDNENSNANKEREQPLDNFDNDNVLKTLNSAKSELQSTRKDFFTIWINAMRDFLADDIMNFIIEKKSEEFLMEDVNCSKESPVQIKGFFYLHQENHDNFHLKIYDPNENNIFTSLNSYENIFEFNATITGVYKFHLKNNDLSSVDVTFALNQYHDDLLIVKSNDLKPLDNKIKLSLQTIEILTTEYNLLEIHKKKHKIQVKDKYENLFWYTIFETLTLLIICFGQVYHIKKLIDNRIIV